MYCHRNPVTVTRVTVSAAWTFHSFRKHVVQIYLMLDKLDRRISTPWQEQQVSRFLGVFE